MAKTITERLAEAIAQVQEYEDRVAALNEALAVDGKDTASAIWLSERIADREHTLAGAHNDLALAIDQYLQDREAKAREQARNTVTSIRLGGQA